MVVLAGVSAALACATTSAAQGGPAPREARLPAPGGVNRAQALSRLAAAAQVDTPAKAIVYGAEALQLLTAVPEARADVRTHVTTHNVMAAAYLTLGRYDSAAAAAGAGRRLAQRSGDRAGLAHALSTLGALAQRRGDPDRAVAYLADALRIQRALGADSAAAASLTLLGFVYASDFAEYDRALAHQHEALRIRERLGGDPEALATTLNGLGVVYGRLRQGDRALALFRRALALHRAAGADARAAATLSNIGDFLLERGDLAGALAHHRESLALRQAVGDRWALSLARRNIALTYLAMGRPDAAYAELTAALRLGERTGNRGLAARNLLALAAVERARSRPAAAEQAARDALAVASAMGARELVRRAWEALAGAQEADGRLADALASHRRFKTVSDSIFDEATSRRVASLEERYARERREREIERLTSMQAIAALQARERATQRNVIAGAALLLGVVGAAAYRRRARDARCAEALSLTDPLTGVRNRRYVRETVGREMTRRQREHPAGRERAGRPGDAGLAFLLLDVDHFKRVNDTFGHTAGDRLLRDLAHLLEATCGASDVVVRWGGEEFLVVNRCTDDVRARELAERLRAAVAAHVTTLDGRRTLRVTCSIGFAVVPRAADGAAWGWEAVVALADHGAYAAKGLGRNAWVGYSAGDRAPPLAPPHAPPTLAPDAIETWVADGWLRRERSTDAPELAIA